MPPHELATLAMLYDDHAGKHNRHSSQRWMRRFAEVAAVAGDALEMGDRPLAIRVLCEVVPLEEAIKLTRETVWATGTWTSTVGRDYVVGGRGQLHLVAARLIDRGA